jgi:tetratricopeptide (TPR) repeat protein
VTRRNQTLFGLFAFVLACSLVASLIGPILIDFFSDEDTGASVSVDESIEVALRSAAEASPPSADSSAALASYLANTGRLPEAIPWFERAIALDSDNSELRVTFGRALVEGGMAGDAEFQFERAIALDDTNPRAHFYLAELYDQSYPRRVIDALEAYERTIEVGPDTFVAERAATRVAEILGEQATPIASPNATPVIGEE